jgi:hypothetical protein
MIDERESVARVAKRFTLPEPRFERLRRRRDRKRRNERLAAGTAGLTIAVLAIVVALRTVAADVSLDAGTTPSPTPAATDTTRFESQLYGYALTHPDDWTAAASSTPWTSGPLTLEVADVLRGVDTEGIFLAAASIEIPEGMSPEEWLDREERRAIAVAGLGGAGSFFVPTIVDGIAGRLSADCGVVLAVEDRRGYVFRLYGDITVNTDLRDVIRSIELLPEAV